ncbi:hypothetical protein ABVT39_023077, partial [Epinephelus coioides]
MCSTHAEPQVQQKVKAKTFGAIHTNVTMYYPPPTSAFGKVIMMINMVVSLHNITIYHE